MSSKMLAALITAVAMILAACITAVAMFLSQTANREVTPYVEPESSSPDIAGPTDQPIENGQEGADEDQAELDSSEVTQQPTTIWLAELEPVVKTGLWYSGVAEVRATTYVHAIESSQTGVRGQTVFAQYALNGNYDRLTGLVGIADGGHSSERAFFEIIVDGVVKQEFEVAIGQVPGVVEVDLGGASDLTLQVTNISGSAFWANPVFADFLLQ